MTIPFEKIAAGITRSKTPPDQEEHDFEINVRSMEEVLAWAEENIPGRLKRITSYTLDDGRHCVRLLVIGGGQATGLKLVFDTGR